MQLDYPSLNTQSSMAGQAWNPSLCHASIAKARCFLKKSIKSCHPQPAVWNKTTPGGLCWVDCVSLSVEVYAIRIKGPYFQENIFRIGRGAVFLSAYRLHNSPVKFA
ncbi:Hypothetical predicted protein [Podarcis lilfordi]|uniref:Uncharacterized protein n=1 Tax=Podarcis lilfordi TaxID=74358 RepID=A0AA35NW62_9SAUR|nr:Hypothetical predicted protein [Podarcis lilfordi]